MPFRLSAKDEAEANKRIAEPVAGVERGAVDRAAQAALTALREDTRHW
jgi:hypothetical protein